MLTVADIQRLAPKALPEYVDALVGGHDEMMLAGLNTSLRMACFLGQCAHETGGFTIVRENTNWTPQQMTVLWPSRFKTTLDPRIVLAKGDQIKLANVAYSNRRSDLGNIGGDDGWDYRGGGFLQHTGRACYAETGAAIGVDLEGDPQLIEDAPISLSASLYTWGRHDLNRFADRGYIRAVGNAINRGDPYSTRDPIGQEGRQRWTERAMATLGAHLPAADELALGAYGPKVEQLQARLKALGYAIGGVDQVFGPTLARAVAAFKLDHQRHAGEPLELAELVGPLMWRALDQARPLQVSAERQGATVKTLLAKGSTEADAGMKAQHAGRLLTLGGAFEGAREIGVLDALQLQMSKVSMLKATLVPALDAFQWASRNAFWVAMFVGGVWFYMRGYAILKARLAAHRSGANLGR